MIMNAITRNIPNTITCVNLASGCMAILCALNPGIMGSSLPSWQWACIFIGIAAVADFLDGFAARLLHAYSELGKELDSLCDLVSFGVAPAMIMFHTLSASDAAWWRWAVILIPVLGALRLAKFNIDTRQTTSFIGLPIPANAIFWIGYAFMASEAGWMLSPAVVLPVIVVESWLMVSELRMYSLKFKTWGWKGNEARYLLMAAAVVCVFSAGCAGLFWLIVYYILSSAFPFFGKRG